MNYFFMVPAILQMQVCSANVCVGGRSSECTVSSYFVNKSNACNDFIFTATHWQKTIDTSAPEKINISLAQRINILSFTKVTENNDKADIQFKRCETWKLNVTQLNSIIRKFKQVSSEEQYLGYSVMPCQLKGIIRIDKRIIQHPLRKTLLETEVAP